MTKSNVHRCFLLSWHGLGMALTTSCGGALFLKIWSVYNTSLCNILTSDPAVDQETGASGRRYLGITLTVDGLNWVQM